MKHISALSETAERSDSENYILRPAFRIGKVNGEPCRRILDELGLLDSSCKPFADDFFLYIPLLKYPEKEERLKIGKAVGNQFSAPLNRPVFTMPYLKDISFQIQKKSLTVSEILGFTIAYEIIGDIAVIDDKIADSDSADSHISQDISKIADAILTAHPSVKTILLSTGPISGEFRTRPLKFIAGINKTATIHKEYGCKYKIDLQRAYFTPRLSTERHRILSQIKKDDVVIDMFAGVGPYSIMIAKNASPKCVIANDKNADAVSLLRENIDLNKAAGVTALNEDALFLSEKYPKTGDHVIMNLPHNAFDFLDTAVAICKPGGVIHYYAMTSEDDLFDGSIELIKTAAKKQNRDIEVVEKKAVRSYAPHQYNICLDVRIL
jgi:Predicted methyltransferase